MAELQSLTPREIAVKEIEQGNKIKKSLLIGAATSAILGIASAITIDQNSGVSLTINILSEIALFGSLVLLFVAYGLIGMNVKAMKDGFNKDPQNKKVPPIL